MKTFVIGDIHGAFKALLQCLKLSQFDKKNDRLISLGDVCDRGKKIKECIDLLLTIPNCVYILGNHDAWALEWATTGKPPLGWLEQGGSLTAKSYKNGMAKEHIEFLSKAKLWFLENNKLFVHAGFDPNAPLEGTSRDILIWDRNLIKQAQQLQKTDPGHKFGNYDEVYVGHTPTINFGKIEPQHFCNIWALDTGAGWGAKLTIMDVETKQYWQA
jgi:serine/threonine protein phosphatase 1